MTSPARARSCQAIGNNPKRLRTGEPVSTVLHDDIREVLRQANDRGIFPVADCVRILQAADQVSARQAARDGTQHHPLLPENFHQLAPDAQAAVVREQMPRLFTSEILRAPQDGTTGSSLPPGFISQNQSAISTHAGERAAGNFRTFTTALRARLELSMDQARSGGIERAHIGDSQTNSTTGSQTNTTSTPGEPSFTETLPSTLANPPQNHNFEPSHETRPRIIEIARANGIEIVTPAGRSQSDGIPDPLRAHTRRIRETYGVETIYYRGGPGGQLGFSPRGNPDLIFINVDPSRSDIPLSWTTSHELLHVAQKDPHAGATEFAEKLTSLLTPAELEEAHNTLASFGYPLPSSPPSCPVSSSATPSPGNPSSVSAPWSARPRSAKPSRHTSTASRNSPPPASPIRPTANWRTPGSNRPNSSQRGGSPPRGSR